MFKVGQDPGHWLILDSLYISKKVIDQKIQKYYYFDVEC